MAASPLLTEQPLVPVLKHHRPVSFCLFPARLARVSAMLSCCPDASSDYRTWACSPACAHARVIRGCPSADWVSGPEKLLLLLLLLTPGVL